MLGSASEVGPAREAFVNSLIDVHGMPPEQAAHVPIAGDPPAVAERLGAFGAAGAERMVLNLDGDDWYRQCELLAEANALVA